MSNNHNFNRASGGRAGGGQRPACGCDSPTPGPHLSGQLFVLALESKDQISVAGRPACNAQPARLLTSNIDRAAGFAPMPDGPLMDTAKVAALPTTISLGLPTFDPVNPDDSVHFSLHPGVMVEFSGGTPVSSLPITAELTGWTENGRPYTQKVTFKPSFLSGGKSVYYVAFSQMGENGAYFCNLALRAENTPVISIPGATYNAEIDGTPANITFVGPVYPSLAAQKFGFTVTQGPNGAGTGVDVTVTLLSPSTPAFDQFTALILGKGGASCCSTT